MKSTVGIHLRMPPDQVRLIRKAVKLCADETVAAFVRRTAIAAATQAIEDSERAAVRAATIAAQVAAAEMP